VTLGVQFPAVRLEPYAPAWADAYEEERERIVSVLGNQLLGIEHVGSTAIPGISAKPIIDIAIGVSALSVAEKFVAPLSRIGYDYAGDGGVPNHRIFGRGPRLRTHLVHAVVADGPEWRNYLLFRDILLNNPQLVREYASLKIALAAKFPDDRPSYTNAKGQFIEKVLNGAA
jgi:GrpB-like predicted nucleotidyltransferase (UPF0157 family)